MTTAPDPGKDAAPREREACVAILLSTYNGAKYIAEQLDSIIGQTHTNWVLHISDDGSTDQTCQIIQAYIERNPTGKISLHTGPRKGFAQNFLSLVRKDEIAADYYAFCDQDDFWLPGKIERALEFAKRQAEGPYLYCSRTRLVDEAGNPIGYSPLFTRPPCFGNALVQSLAGANTMLFNNPARELLRAVPLTTDIVSHDWLVYMLVSGCGGRVTYDALPSIHYRQHNGNLVGANVGLAEKLKRLLRVVGGTYSRWNESNLALLSRFESCLTEANRQALADFAAARRATGWQAWGLLNRSGVFRQNRLDDLAMKAAALIGKI